MNAPPATQAQPSNANAIKARWTCRTCKSAGRNQPYADEARAIQAGLSFALWHQAQDGPDHETAIELDGQTIDLQEALKRLGLKLPTQVIKVQAASPNQASQPGSPLIEVGERGPVYVAQNGEVDDLKAALKAGMNALLCGPTGCGKTHLIADVAFEEKKRLYTIQGSDGATYEQIVGYRTIENGNVQWVDGLLPRAMREGAILYADEPNALPDGIRFLLFSAMDHRREVTLPENAGEVVKAVPGFTVVASMNEGQGYSGTTLLSHAFRDRFDVVVDLDYLSEDREVSLIRDRTGLDKKTSQRIVNVASKLRAGLKQRQVRTPVSTRTLIAWATLIRGGYDPAKAAGLTLVARVPGSDANERKAFKDVVDAVFATAVNKAKQDAEVEE